MDFKKLKYFLTVAKEESVTKAANKLYMTQPPLSYQLKTFEEELGIKLLEKDGRKIRLTEQGQYLYEKGPLIIELVNKTVKELHQLKNSLQQIFTIGNASPWGYTILPQQIKKLNDSFPDVSFQLWQDDTFRIMDLLNSGEIEVAFVTFPTDPNIYESIPLNAESVYAFFGSIYDYGHQPDRITLQEVAESPTIMVHAHMYELFSAYYQRIKLKAKLSSYNVVVSMLDWLTTEPWIIIGPKSVFDINFRSDVKCKLIIDPNVEVISFITWRKDHKLSKAARCFIDTILDTFQPITRKTNTEIYQLIGEPDRLHKRTYSGNQ